MTPPDQSISETTWVNVPSSVLTGWARLVSLVVTVHPLVASGVTLAMGWVVGSWTRRPTTSAPGSSSGTWKLRTSDVESRGALVGLTVTWAHAVVGHSTTRVAITAAGAHRRAPRIAGIAVPLIGRGR